MKSFAIVESENKEIIYSIQEYFGNNCPIISLEDNFDNYDLIVLTGFESKCKWSEKAEIINFHPSLLPSFKGEDALKQSFLSGVKVGGVSIHRVEENNFYGKIIAQYPVLIGLTTNFYDYTKEVEAVAKKLYPVVIDSIVNDRVFDFPELFKTSCASTKCSCSNSSCSNCSKCSGCKGC